MIHHWFVLTPKQDKKIDVIVENHGRLSSNVPCLLEVKAKTFFPRAPSQDRKNTIY